MDNFADKTFKEGFGIGWLVAAIEGEGHITLAWCRHGKNMKTIQIMPRIGIGNLEISFVERAKEYCDLFNIPSYINKSNRMFSIMWYGMKRVKRLLDVVLPYLTFKKERAKLVADFINYRLSKPRNFPYGQVEKDLFMKVRDIHGKGFIPHKDLSLAFESNLNDYTLDAQIKPSV